MLTIDELAQTMKEREDCYSVLDLLDPTVEELVDSLFQNEELLNKNYQMLVEYYEDEVEE